MIVILLDIFKGRLWLNAKPPVFAEQGLAKTAGIQGIFVVILFSASVPLGSFGAGHPSLRSGLSLLK
ncbi:hypothetical protein BIY27_19370 [Gibbsiella quercinecans]|nr:hypothetical protein BIY27_19370 [Gibbsiella quercinecans]